jgi:glycosyltransferase involved in cell wall biosynthesis
MRILTVGNLYPPHHLGGYELVWQSANDHLRAKGNQVRILTTTHRENGVEGPDDPDARRDLDWYWRGHAFPSMSWRRRLLLERKNAEILDRQIEEFKPDVVGWWAMGGMSLSLIEQARLRGLPAAGFVCDDWMSYGPKVDAWLRTFDRPVIGPVATRLTGIPSRLDLDSIAPWVFPSESTRRPAVKRWGLTETKVVPQGVDHFQFRPSPAKDWGWRLAYVGRIDPRKGIALAIEALSHLPEQATLQVIGNGDSGHLEQLRQRCRDLGLTARVKFVARVPRDELPGHYASADAVLFPVLWEEPWGLVPLEAMAVGVPVIASGRGGSGEYLQDGENCLLFEPDEGPAALASAIERIAASESTRAQLRDGGFKTSQGFRKTDFDRAVERALHEAVGINAGSERRRGAR